MHDDGFFDDRVAASYDAVHGTGEAADVQQAVQTLKSLCPDGTALEFAIGTGRVALPLQALGVAVSGIEMSRPMVAQLRAKETGPAMDVRIGDMTCAKMGQRYGLVYLVYNTIDNLTTQDAQIACFENAARHLRPGGRFVIETLVPPIQKIPFGERHRTFARSEDHWGIDTFDVVSQTYGSHHMRRQEDGSYRAFSAPFRYAWPAELDLMARIAGLTLQNRWSGFDRAPFGATSTSHVSVWTL